MVGSNGWKRFAEAKRLDGLRGDEDNNSVPSEGRTGTLREVSGVREGAAGADDELALGVAGLKLYWVRMGVDLENDGWDDFGVERGGGRCCSSCRS